ncbi:oxamate carbamoyltransferase subunit AllH family protein, partial [Lysinibacillus xylanilyticus]
MSFTSYESTDFEPERVLALIDRLHDPTQNLEKTFRYFIGRGQGLTPTGDDILVGILYGHFLNNFIEQKHLETLKALIKEPLTTIVSKRFLTCALDGVFSSKITVLQHDPSLESMKSLIEVGSSSGMDTLYG